MKKLLKYAIRIITILMIAFILGMFMIAVCNTGLVKTIIELIKILVLGAVLLFVSILFTWAWEN